MRRIRSGCCARAASGREKNPAAHAIAGDKLTSIKSYVRGNYVIDFCHWAAHARIIIGQNNNQNSGIAD
jgi:hypothetical protein